MARTRHERHRVITQLMVERLALGMTQREVAEAAGISRDAVSAMETGKRGGSIAAAEKYANALGFKITLTR